MALNKIFFIFMFTNLLFTQKWEKEFSKEGITVWSQKVAGSKIKKVKATCIINAPSEKIWQGLETPSKFLKVMPDVVESKNIGKCGKNCKFTYQRLHHPPLKDRHYIIKVTWEKTKLEDGGILIKHRWHKAKNKNPGPKYMNLNNIYGRWNFVPKGKGSETLFTYVSFIDLGGLVPAPLVNSSIKKNAFKFLRNLRSAAPGW